MRLQIGKLDITFGQNKSLAGYNSIIEPDGNGGIFVPIDFTGNNLKGNGNIFYQNAFNQVPEVNSVISTKANMRAKVNLQIVKRGTTDLYTGSDASNLQKILLNPNWYQSQKEFLRQCSLFYSVFGNEIDFFMWGASIGNDQYLKQISSLNFINIRVLEDESQPLFLMTNESKKVGYEYNFKGKTILLKEQEIMHLTENNVSDNSELLGVSKLESLKQPIENIYNAYDSRGFFLKNRGAVNILTNDYGADNEIVPLDEKQKLALQNEWKKYGTTKNQLSVLITNMKLKVQSVTQPVKDLMLFEEIQEDFYKICDSFGMDYDLFANQKGATFENKKQAEKKTYESTIIPESLEWVGALNKILGLEKRPYEIIGTFEHLQIFSDNKKERAQSLLSLTTALDKALLSGAITIEQYKIELQRYGIN